MALTTGCIPIENTRSTRSEGSPRRDDPEDADQVRARIARSTFRRRERCARKRERTGKCVERICRFRFRASTCGERHYLRRTYRSSGVRQTCGMYPTHSSFRRRRPLTKSSSIQGVSDSSPAHATGSRIPPPKASYAEALKAATRVPTPSRPGQKPARDMVPA